jgi:hypothetical protein
VEHGGWAEHEVEVLEAVAVAGLDSGICGRLSVSSVSTSGTHQIVEDLCKHRGTKPSAPCVEWSAGSYARSWPGHRPSGMAPVSDAGWEDVVAVLWRLARDTLRRPAARS